MDDIKESLSRLTSDGLIYDLNKDKPKKTGEGNESFKIVGEGGADAICQTENTHIQDGDREKLFSDEAYINDKFNETLRKLIKSEVHSVKSELTTTVECVECTNSRTNKCNDVVIEIITKQLEFLQKELQTKDEIILMLLNERKRVTLNNSDKNITVNKPNQVTDKTDDVIINGNIKRKISHDITSTTNNDGEFVEVTNKKKRKKGKLRTISVFGDSMIKDLNAYDMSKLITKKNERIYNNVYSGATTSDMYHHAVPVMKYNPDCVILHTGTNSLRETESAQQQAQDIITLATSLKTDENEIAISSILPRRDRLQEKAQKVNDFLLIKCRELGIPYISHPNITANELKPKGLHLNKKGSELLSANLVNFVNM